ncbi:RNA-binding protein [Roseiconus nitratireducens]|uniref:RNA-binding protein n=1 Tax=Roseiconus nitratireducens TaxID=2605748 RepID=A0A5M6D2X5_9BACT|nr:FG-GAP-like repeat-containing protein [Roseiconus nitratireducens]KAA5541867.1 RNA-binding protein [Roseiconus nitratireducens]
MSRVCGWFLVMVAVAEIGCGRVEPSSDRVRDGVHDRAGWSETASPGQRLDPEDLVTTARLQMSRGQYAQAGQVVQSLLAEDPNHADALEIGGQIAEHFGKSARAIEFYERSIAGADQPSSELLDRLGQQYMNVGRPFEALQSLRKAVDASPEDAQLREKLVGLFCALALQRQSAPHLKWLIQHGHGNIGLLVILSDLRRPQTVNTTCEYALEHSPDDLRPKYSLACLPAYHGKWNEVVDDLASVVDRHPDFTPAQGLLGRALVETGDWDAVERWMEGIPREVEDEPQYWMALGSRAEHRNDLSAAARAYWRAVELNENDGEALAHLAATLAELGRSEDSRLAAKRASNITSLREAVDSLLSWRNNSQSAAVDVALALEDLGRKWEATACLQAAFRMTQNKDPRLDEVYKRVRSTLTGRTPWQSEEQLVAANLDLSDLSRDTELPAEEGHRPGMIAACGQRIQLVDRAAERNLDHVCRIGKVSGDQAGLAIYQSGAGGAGVIDYDLDGWPDLYLTEMDGQPRASDSSANELYRNLDERFVRQTGLADVGDQGFAQGVTVGDYNADGFPDLLVANIGTNRLYRNNGDGTFRDVTDQAGLSGKEWTTSSALVDLDDDGHADLFQVSYCGGEAPYHQQCMDPEVGQPRSCNPLAFDAEPDRVWRGQGDGTFVDATSQWLGEHQPGRGFGLVVGQLDKQGSLDVYVANDMTANHYWSRDAESDAWRFSEQAMLRGLAVNERSLSQASMGIAAGDADQDGDVDFLLSHFSGDHNTFYEQVGQGTWADRSRRVGLAAPSQRMLGYGTQWVDLQNDGSPELVVANGDIDDFTHKDRFFRQPVQLFDRGPDGRWNELTGGQLGEYFARQHLARAVVTWDADRDGRTDLLITHLFEPVSLLSNETETECRRSRFFLKATRSHRDAIGAEVSLQIGDRRLEGQLLAGDGFQCSNERCVSFGVGFVDRIDQLTVRWPSGWTERFGATDSGHDVLLIEGAGEPFRMDAAR